MNTKQIDNWAEIRWLLKQAQDYYRYSKDKHTPGARATNRKKFIATVKQLLPLTNVETIEAWVCGNPVRGDTQDAAAIIKALAAQASVKPQEAHSAPQSSVDVSEVNRLLAAGIEPLLKALKLLNREAVK